MDTQKKAFRAEERNTERIERLRESFIEWQGRVDAGRLFCLDEAGFLKLMQTQRFVPGESGRYWVALSLREAESLRGAMLEEVDEVLLQLVIGERNDMVRVRLNEALGNTGVARDGHVIQPVQGF